MPRRLSQRQIAEDLGVSQSLVSLVLNGRRERISEDKYQKIWEHAVRSGYSPKGMRPLHAPEVEESHGTQVGVILRSGIKLATQSNTYSHVHQGLDAVLRADGNNTVFLGTEGELDEAEILRIFAQQNPLRGIVVMGEVRANFIKAIRELQRDVVSVYASYPGLCHSVLPNERQAVEHLVEHLTELGHTRFAWLGGNREMGRNRARQEAMVEALHVRGIELPEKSVVNVVPADRQDGFDTARDLCDRFGGQDLPTAWICHNGLMTQGAMRFTMQSGIRVPEDVSVVALDMTRVCEEIHPHLTSASSHPEQIGSKAAELLLKSHLKDEDICTDLVLPSRLVVRETSGPPPKGTVSLGSPATAAQT